MIMSVFGQIALFVNVERMNIDQQVVSIHLFAFRVFLVFGCSQHRNSRPAARNNGTAITLTNAHRTTGSTEITNNTFYATGASTFLAVTGSDHTRAYNNIFAANASPPVTRAAT